jgi:hypothetical protein
MSRNLVTVHSTDPVVEALKLFVNTRHGRLPVLDDLDRPVGILTKGDITLGLLKALQRDYQAEEVRRYRASHLFEDIISDRTSLILRYTIQQGDFTKGGSPPALSSARCCAWAPTRRSPGAAASPPMKPR